MYITNNHIAAYPLSVPNKSLLDNIGIIEKHIKRSNTNVLYSRCDKLFKNLFKNGINIDNKK